MTAPARPSKRRPGPTGGGAAVADPRPKIFGEHLAGWECPACGHRTVHEGPWCPECTGPLTDARFALRGTIWSSTVVRFPVGRHAAPFAVAYVDLGDGPRVFAHLAEPATLAPGTEVVLEGAADGDLLARPLDGGGGR